MQDNVFNDFRFHDLEADKSKLRLERRVFLTKLYEKGMCFEKLQRARHLALQRRNMHFPRGFDHNGILFFLFPLWVGLLGLSISVILSAEYETPSGTALKNPENLGYGFFAGFTSGELIALLIFIYYKNYLFDLCCNPDRPYRNFSQAAMKRKHKEEIKKEYIDNLAKHEKNEVTKIKLALGDLLLELAAKNFAIKNVYHFMLFIYPNVEDKLKNIIFEKRKDILRMNKIKDYGLKELVGAIYEDFSSEFDQDPRCEAGLII